MGTIIKAHFQALNEEMDLIKLEKSLENHLPLSSQMLNIVRQKLQKRFTPQTPVDFYIYEEDFYDPWDDPFVVCVQHPNIHSLHGLVLRVPSSPCTPKMIQTLDTFLDWDKVEMFSSVCQTFYDNFLKGLCIKNGKIPEDLPCEAYVLNTNLALTYESEYSGREKITLKELSEKDASQVLANYGEWRRPHSLEQVKLSIRNACSGGVYSEGDLAAFALLSPIGLVNILYTEIPFRRRGFGVEVMKSLGKRVASMGMIPRAESTLENDSSRDLQLKAGYKFVGRITWIKINRPYKD